MQKGIEECKRKETGECNKNRFESNWDKMSTAYENFTNGENSYSNLIEWPCIKNMLPNLDNSSILDMGCGTGRFTFLLEKYTKNKVCGIDISANMLEIAKTKANNNNSNVKFIKGDIQHLSTYTNEKFDFAFSSTTFHYVENLEKMFSQINKLLNKGAACIFSVIHPVYSSEYPIYTGDFPKDENWGLKYLNKNQRGYIQPWIEFNEDIENHLSISYHHTFSDYTNAILKAGFNIEQIEEPYPPNEWKEEQFSRYNSFINSPVFLVFKITKK